MNCQGKKHTQSPNTSHELDLVGFQKIGEAAHLTLRERERDVTPEYGLVPKGGLRIGVRVR